MGNIRDEVPAQDGPGSDPNFLTLRLDGPRFQGGRIPLEVLADLAGLSELLIETAKWRFLEANPGRKRSPRGFTKGVELSLTEIKNGSAVPVIALSVVAATPSLFPREIATYMPQARDAVVEAIAAASSKRPIGLPEHLLAYFDTFGRNLGESESIEFPGARTEQLAKLNKLTRRALLLASAGIDEWTDVTEVRGLVPEADQGRKSFEVELTDGRKISGPLTAQHRVQLLEAFNGYANRQRVAIDCIGRFNRSNQIVGIDSIEQVTLLDPLDISARIDDLRNLRDGWLNGDGKAPNPTHLWRLEHLFESHYPDTIVPPHLYPTPEGNVSAEWSLPPHEVSAEIDVATLACHVHLLDLETDRDRTEELNLAGEPGWARLVALIGELPGGRL